MLFTFDFSMFLYIFVGILLSIKLYSRLKLGLYKGTERLDGKTVIVTGANSGIGFVSAKDFAKRGAKVILACRNMKTAEEAKKEIIKETGNSQIITKQLDLTSFASVRKCANEILSEESKIDVLLNNAGVGSSGDSNLTADGLHPLMQANYFGPFLFTNILLGKIKQSSPSRIVNVSSSLHKMAKMDFNYLKNGGTSNSSSHLLIYSNSKLGNIYFSNYLAELVKGTGVTVNSLHPGSFASNITRNHSAFFQWIWSFFTSIFMKSIEEAAHTSICLCVSPELENVSGKYFSDCLIARNSETSKDMGIAKKLWELTEKVVDLKDIEKHY